MRSLAVGYAGGARLPLPSVPLMPKIPRPAPSETPDPVENSQFLGSVLQGRERRFPPHAARRLAGRPAARASIWSLLLSIARAGAARSSASISPDKPQSFDELIANSKSELNKTFKGVQILQSRSIDFQGKQAIRFDISMEAALGAAADGGLSLDDHTMKGRHPAAPPIQRPATRRDPPTTCWKSGCSASS